ncbi:ABC transporter ATP-binding protein [Microbacterium terregens]
MGGRSRYGGQERDGGEMAIEVVGLTKRYRDKVAVDDISFSVPDGGVFAFVGTNGAGKSTTIGCLTTVLPFDAGEVRVRGHDVRREGDQVRESIGVVFQESLLDPLLTVRENLRLRGSLSRLAPGSLAARITDVSGLIGLEEFLDRRYGKLSGGQRRRVDIARALLHEPAVLFLDEPTAGLDPASRALVWHTLHELSVRSDLTVFLTTHYLEETEEAARVCIIDDGRIIADDTPARLRAQYSRSLLTVTTDDPAALIALARAAGADPTRDGDLVVIAVEGAQTARRLLAAHGDAVRDFEFRHGRMDDVFLALTGRSAAEVAAA